MYQYNILELMTAESLINLATWIMSHGDDKLRNFVKGELGRL